MRFSSLILVAVILTSGCVQTSTVSPEKKYSLSSAGTAGTISYCRPSNIIGSIPKLRLYIDEIEVSKIKNGSKGSLPIDLGSEFKFGNPKSYFMMRPKGEVAYTEWASEKKDRFFLIKGKANLAVGVGASVGGYVGGNKVAGDQDLGKANWSVRTVSRNEFEASCI